MIYNNILECIGNTPIIRLQHMTTDHHAEILVKYEGVKGVTPGQVCALYDGDRCLGSGIIKEVRKDNKKLWYL